MAYPEIFGLVDTAVFITLVILLFIILSRTTKGKVERKLLLSAFFLKVISTPLYLLYHQYVQKIGDIFQYQRDASFIAETFYTEPVKFFKLVFTQITEEKYPDIDTYFHLFLFEKDEAFIAKTGGLIGVFFNGSFLNVSLIFSMIALAGTWRIFLVYKRLYPELIKPLGIATLFIPSVVFWGCAITKDSLCIGALGFLYYSLFQIFVFKEKIFINAIIVLLCLGVFLNVKIYIFLAVFPTLIISFIFKFIEKIKNKLIRIAVVPTLLISFLLLIWVSKDYIDNLISDLAFEKLLGTISTNYQYLSKDTAAGSSYDLGTLEPTLSSMFSKFFASINVTLFRPYIWEIKNPAMAIAAVESVITILFTIFVLIKVGIIRSVRLIIGNSELLFSILFCVIFAFAIGISSGNFGTLMRYKIPLMPFYFSALVILLKLRKRTTPVQ